MKTDYKKLALVLALVPLLGATSAWAVPLTGSIGFGGNWERSGGGNSIAFIDSAVVLDVDGDYAAVFTPFVTMLQFNDFDFEPFTGPHELWSFDGFTFTVDSAVTITNVGDNITLNGTGTIVADGFDPTPTVWDFSTNSLTFSTANVTAGPVEVPEPGALALLGLMLVGYRLRSNKRRA